MVTWPCDDLYPLELSVLLKEDGPQSLWDCEEGEWSGRGKVLWMNLCLV